jgi:beta-glucanase (GH16 family)
MTTDSPTNSFVKDGKLYILPTLTSDIIGRDAIFNGYTYNLTGCTNEDWKACGIVSNSTTGTVISPVQSARLTTRKSHNIQYGRVEVRAKNPRGYERIYFALPFAAFTDAPESDWLWPAIWMLPVDSAYGPWPMSG